MMLRVRPQRAENSASEPNDVELFAKGFPGGGAITVPGRDGLELVARVIGEGGVGVVGVEVTLDATPDNVANCRPSQATTTSGGNAAFNCMFVQLAQATQVAFTAALISARALPPRRNTLTATVQVRHHADLPCCCLGLPDMTAAPTTTPRTCCLLLCAAANT